MSNSKAKTNLKGLINSPKYANDDVFSPDSERIFREPHLKSIFNYPSLEKDINYGKLQVSVLNQESEFAALSNYLVNGCSNIFYFSSNLCTSRVKVLKLLTSELVEVDTSKVNTVPHIYFPFSMNKLRNGLYIDIGVEVPPEVMLKVFNMFAFQTNTPNLRRPGKFMAASDLATIVYIDIDSSGLFMSDGFNHTNYRNDDLISGKIVISAPSCCYDTGFFTKKARKPLSVIELPTEKAGFGRFLLNFYFLQIDNQSDFTRLDHLYVGSQTSVHNIFKNLVYCAIEIANTRNINSIHFVGEYWYSHLKANFPELPF